MTKNFKSKLVIIMNQTFQALMEKRVTAGNFDPHRSVGLDLVRKLVQIATLAPSAFNLQNWRFIGVHSASAKKRLCELAYGQRQVLDASVTFIVCGELDGYCSLRETLKPSVDAGILPSEVQET